MDDCFIDDGCMSVAINQRIADKIVYKLNLGEARFPINIQALKLEHLNFINTIPMAQRIAMDEIRQKAEEEREKHEELELQQRMTATQELNFKVEDMDDEDKSIEHETQ